MDLVNPQTLVHFDRLARLATGRRGRGIELSAVGDCHALARMLSGQDPRDPERFESLATRIGLTVAEAEGRDEHEEAA